jgi:hypothetical protein
MKSLFFLFLVLCSLVSSWAATTVNPANKYAYAANLGWMDWRGDTNSGAVIGEYVCSGYIWAANVGWIHLGSNAPVNGIQYQNNSATDYGVNHDGLGNLRGYAYGANIGWVNFENLGAPKFDLKTGRLSGSVYSANCGWISLSNAFVFVQTDTIAPGTDNDGDGIADAWERLHFGNLTTANAISDFDGDGVSDKNEYLAGTNPNDLSDYLSITALSATPGGTTVDLTWKSTLSRCYYIQKRLDLNIATPWLDSGLGLLSPDGTATTRSILDANAPMRFYRIEAVKPLSP